MRRIYIFLILIAMIFAGACVVKSNIQAEEETQMQKVIKKDLVTGDGIEFNLKLYTLQNLSELIPSISNTDYPNIKHDKYVFCIVKNLSQRNAIYLEFKVKGKEPNQNLCSPSIAMTWLPTTLFPDSQQYALVRIGNLYTPDTIDKVKLDVEILELKRK